VSPQAHHLRETHVRCFCRSIKFTLLGNATEDLGIINFGHLVHLQMEEDWGRKVSGLVLGYDLNALFDS
jgi:hypothetical protein